MDKKPTHSMGVGGMAQWVNYLPPKCEGWSSDLHNPCQSQVGEATCNPSADKVEMGSQGQTS